MKVNVKSEKGAITLIALVTMLFLISFLMTMYIRISNKAQTSAETTAEIAKKYNNVGDADVIYDNYFGTEEVIPITNKEELLQIGSGENVEVNGKIYNFKEDGYYTLQNNIDFEEDDEILTIIPDEFSGIIDGLGNTIKGMYTNDNMKVLFDAIEGPIKNLNIEGKVFENNITLGRRNSENITYKINGEGTAIIPKGFMVSGNKDEISIENGLVIYDDEDNEFVWIPVEDGKLDRTEWLDNEPTETIRDSYIEEIPEEIENSISKYKGFYIGRYEAGLESPRTSNSTPYPEAKVQKGLYPYNFIPWQNSTTQTGAVTVSANMYKDEDNFGVKSTLVYGAMWDEMLRLVKDEVDITNSTSWGNHKDSTFEFSGNYIVSSSLVESTSAIKPKDTAWLLTTGASEKNKVKNMYDLAGNIMEWTMENYNVTNQALRGSSYMFNGDEYPASFRNVGPGTNGVRAIGFRIALYIK